MCEMVKIGELLILGGKKEGSIKDDRRVSDRSIVTLGVELLFVI